MGGPNLFFGGGQLFGGSQPFWGVPINHLRDPNLLGGQPYEVPTLLGGAPNLFGGVSNPIGIPTLSGGWGGPYLLGGVPTLTYLWGGGRGFWGGVHPNTFTQPQIDPTALPHFRQQNTWKKHRMDGVEERGGGRQSLPLLASALARSTAPGLGYGRCWKRGPAAVVSAPVLASLRLGSPVDHVPRGASE